MKRTLFYSVAVCLLVLIACQKGIHWDFPSEGTLTKDVNGNCLPVMALGTFMAHKAINDSNFLTVNVDVTVPGTYTITSDSVNGYAFKALGIFSKKGTTTVTLTCSGTPLFAGTDHFTISYNNSICEASVMVKTDTVPSAAYTLFGSQGNCMDDSIKGSYIKSVTLDTANKVIISVNVTVPGSYLIVTNTVNGYHFSGEGLFFVTGVQTVTLTGKGEPADKGTDLFKITTSSNTCSFTVLVADVVPVVNTEHFPLKIGSFWTYDDLTSPGDSIVRRINRDTVINMDTYLIMDEQTKFNALPYYFYKGSNNYYEYGRVDKYTGSFQYATSIYSYLNFLNEDIPSGASWESEEFKSVASFGQIIYLKYYFTCLKNNAAIVINGQGFKDVYIIAVYPQLKSENNSWGSTNEIYYYYYAKGIGLIYMESGTYNYMQPKMQIRNWHIN